VGGQRDLFNPAQARGNPGCHLAVLITKFKSDACKPVGESALPAKVAQKQLTAHSPKLSLHERSG
jgi:hypothetical protein